MRDESRRGAVPAPTTSTTIEHISKENAAPTTSTTIEHVSKENAAPTASFMIEQVIATIATRQHGVVTRAQLLGAGMSPDVVDRRAKTGRLKRIHRGVYLVGPIAPPLAREMAAVLACGERAVLSHTSAAACWKMLPVREDHVHVLVSGVRPGPKTGMCIHRVSLLQAGEITTHHHIPITTPARTLYDLAASTSERELERALAEAFALRLTNRSAVAEQVRRHNGRPGARRLQTLLEGGSRPALTRSEAEERFLTLIRKAQLRDPELNVRVEGYEVDFLWREERLVVEIDGRAFHTLDRTFESDRRRDAVLLAAGLRVMRATWRQIVSEPEALLVRLALALAVEARR